MNRLRTEMESAQLAYRQVRYGGDLAAEALQVERDRTPLASRRSRRLGWAVAAGLAGAAVLTWAVVRQDSASKPTPPPSVATNQTTGANAPAPSAGESKTAKHVGLSLTKPTRLSLDLPTTQSVKQLSTKKLSLGDWPSLSQSKPRWPGSGPNRRNPSQPEPGQSHLPLKENLS